MTEQKTICLANLHEATKQEVFDQVAKHLLTQKKRSTSIDDDDQCLYRGDGGLMCAAGCLIADSEYSSSWEGTPWTMLVRIGCVPLAHGRLIRRLQDIHDLNPIDNWYTSLKMLAFDNNLEFKEYV